jgi:hypothetical protein
MQYFGQYSKLYRKGISFVRIDEIEISLFNSARYPQGISLIEADAAHRLIRLYKGFQDDFEGIYH